MLADFGLDELMLPFETRSKEIMKKYATGKYDPEEMNPIGILKSLKKADIRIRSNFLIGFRDESWESVLRTKEFVKELFEEAGYVDCNYKNLTNNKLIQYIIYS